MARLRRNSHKQNSPIMKPFIRQLMLRSTLVLACLLGASASRAQEAQVFAKPAQYCFSQSEWRGGLNQLTFDYHLAVVADDQFKNGDVFVGFRLTGRPEALWLSEGGGRWSAYNASTTPVAYYSGELQPVMQTSIIPQPTDVTAFSPDSSNWGQDIPAVATSLLNGGQNVQPVLSTAGTDSTPGEFLVGYGLRRNAAATINDSFQDMVSNQRYSVVWAIGPPPQQAYTIICLTTTQITVEALAYPSATSQQP